MTLQEFRKRVRTEFGGNLRNMTPANVREFLDRIEPQVETPYGAARRIQLNEPEQTYEGIVRDFLTKVLEMPADQAVIRLWLYSLELTIANVSDMEAEKFRHLFAQLSSLDGD
ncbi:MAG: hypothetical protein K0Q72_560 [Armatimonadetes bacterium]|nr:hypothetical protein [Armatimonadota bacterium]